MGYVEDFISVATGGVHKTLSPSKNSEKLNNTLLSYLPLVVNRESGLKIIMQWLNSPTKSFPLKTVINARGFYRDFIFPHHVGSESTDCSGTPVVRGNPLLWGKRSDHLAITMSVMALNI
jgi:hypothetical protein